MLKLWDHQTECVKEMQEELQAHKGLFLSWYTGAGKTNIIGQYCKEYLQKNPTHKIGISCYLTTEIRDQMFERLEEFGLGEESQILFAQTQIEISKNIYTFNPQAVFNKEKNIKFDLLIIDECHAGMQITSKMLNAIMINWMKRGCKIILASATPWDIIAQKRFSKFPVLKRSLEQGLSDGQVSDVRFHVERLNIEFEETDFSRVGDLKMKSIEARLSQIKSISHGKVENIIRRYDKELGNKILVICPPGNQGEIARDLATNFKGLAFLQRHHWASATKSKKQTVKGINLDTGMNLKRFKEEKGQRFLFVLKKCQVGFDMPELTSIIDLTMTRNIKILAQRHGRLARKYAKKTKRYFYVLDKGIGQHKIDWLLFTMIDFCLGHYDGLTTKAAKHKETISWNVYRYQKHSILVSDIIRSLTKSNAIKPYKELKFVQYSKPVNWTLKKAKAETEKYISRTDMWKKQASSL